MSTHEMTDLERALAELLGGSPKKAGAEKNEASVSREFMERLRACEAQVNAVQDDSPSAR